MSPAATKTVAQILGISALLLAWEIRTPVRGTVLLLCAAFWLYLSNDQ